MRALNGRQSIASVDGCEVARALAKAIQILLVEDHSDTARAICNVLRRSGYEVKVAGNMAEAQQLADETRIDVVVCDIGLPDGDGHKLMRDLKDRHGLKGICISGYGSDEDIEESKAAGFVAHLTKPFDMQTLEALLPQFAR